MNDFTTFDERLASIWRYPGGEVGVRATLTAAPTRLLARVQSSEDLVALLMYLAAVPLQVQTVCVPYLPYARQDRVAVPGDPFAIDVLARLLVSSGVREFVALDAHSPASLAAFAAAGGQLANVAAAPFLDRYLTTLRAEPGRPVWFVAPDKGARTRTTMSANALARPDRPIGVIHCAKVRDPVTGKLQGFVVDDTDSPTALGADPLVVIVDDICDGGGTFFGVAQALRTHYGSTPLHLWTSHGIYSRGLDELLRTFATLGSTDSFRHCHTHERQLTIPLQTKESSR